MGKPATTFPPAQDAGGLGKPARIAFSPRRLLSALASAVPDAVIAADQRGRIVFWNTAAASMLQWSAAEAVGRSAADLLAAPRRRAALRRALARLLADGRPNSIKPMVLPARRKDGSQLDLELSLTAVRDRDRRLVLALGRDVTSARRREERLRARAARYRTLFDSSSDAIMTLTPEEGFLSANPAAVKLFGCRDEAHFVSHGPADLSPERQPDGLLSTDKARKMMQIALEHGSHFFEWRHKRADGREFDATVLLTRYALDGKTYLQATVRDITEQKRNQAAYHRRNEQLRHAQKMEAVGALAGGVAHEFNNLLQAIRGFTNFALESLQAEHPAREDLGHVLAAAERAALLTRQLLDFGRRQPSQVSQIDLNDLVRRLAAMLRPMLGERIAVQLESDDRTPSVRGDETLLQQALMNLCINARDAMPEGGRLAVKTEPFEIDGRPGADYIDLPPGLYARISVADTGCGIPQDVLPRIFDPFFTTKDVGKGTGLGLAMTYGVVEEHRGRITAYSEPGRGTTFRIYLPATAGEVAEAAPSPTAPPGALVLVVDDDPATRKFAARVLEEAGFRVITAADGGQAMQAARQWADSLQVVLLDIDLPGTDGLTLRRQLAGVATDAAIVLASGHELAAAAQPQQAAVLAKPFTASRLLHAVAAALVQRAREPAGRPAGHARGHGI